LIDSTKIEDDFSLRNLKSYSDFYDRASFPNWTSPKYFAYIKGTSKVHWAMGITTLLPYVPVPIAVLHQSGALVTLST